MNNTKRIAYDGVFIGLVIAVIILTNPLFSVLRSTIGIFLSFAIAKYYSRRSLLDSFLGFCAMSILLCLFFGILPFLLTYVLILIDGFVVSRTIMLERDKYYLYSTIILAVSYLIRFILNCRLILHIDIADRIKTILSEYRIFSSLPVQGSLSYLVLILFGFGIAAIKCRIIDLTNRMFDRRFAYMNW